MTIVGNTHHPRLGPLSLELVTSLRIRAPHDRFTPDDLPAVGDVVMVRLDEGGKPVPAVVTRTDSLTEPYPGYAEGKSPPGGLLPDPNVWYVVTGPTAMPIPRPDGLPGYAYRLQPDPWPTIHLRIDPPPGVKGPRIFTHTREERLAGLGGWVRFGKD